MSSNNNNESNKIKLIIYDFDQTISSKHLYHILQGGQLDELSKLNDNDLIEIFGGTKRIERLNKHFSVLNDNNIEVGIMSFGFCSVIKKALQRMKLYHYFKNSTIIGCDSEELKENNFNKGKTVEQLKLKKNLKKPQVIFVDDDPSNVAKAKAYCSALLVTPRDGMSFKLMDDIEKQCGIIKNKAKVIKPKGNTGIDPKNLDKFEQFLQKNNNNGNDCDPVVNIDNNGTPSRDNEEITLSLGLPSTIVSNESTNNSNNNNNTNAKPMPNGNTNEDTNMANNNDNNNTTDNLPSLPNEEITNNANNANNSNNDADTQTNNNNNNKNNDDMKDNN